jgi:hypothetical protein
MELKLIGYGLSIAGLVVVAFSSKISQLPFLASNTKALLYVTMGGIALIAIGIALALTGPSSSKIKQAAEEVPIYEGTGKHRKIVGYQKAGKK